MQCGVLLVLNEMDGNKVSYWVTKAAHSWGQVCVLAVGISVLLHCALETVSIERTIGISVVCNEVRYCLHAKFSATVAMEKYNGGNSVVYTQLWNKVVI